MPQAMVRDLLTSISVSLSLDSSFEEARCLFLESGREVLPVLDEGHVIGILTEADLDRMPRRALRACLRDHLALRVVYCFADSDVVDAAVTMQAAGVAHLAVLGEGACLLGLLSRSELPSMAAARVSRGDGEGTSSASFRYHSI